MEKIMNMKRNVIMFCLVLFFPSCKSYCQHHFFKDIPSKYCEFNILYVQVTSSEHHGLAMIPDLYLIFYYIDYDTNCANFKKNQDRDKLDKYIRNDLKRNIIYPIYDEHNSFIFMNDFDSSLYSVANQGIEAFIQTYFMFDDKNDIFPHIMDSSSYCWQIAKIMYDAGIHIKMTEGGEELFIDDERFRVIPKEGKGAPYFVIPKSYVRKGKNWYKNTWQKQPKEPRYFQRSK